MQTGTQISPNADKIVEQLLRRTSTDSVRALVNAALASSGQAVGAVSYEPGDDLCPTFRFPFPFPPRFGDFLAVAAKAGPFRVFPLGLIEISDVLVQTRVGQPG